mgnify:CR=1 FL=1
MADLVFYTAEYPYGNSETFVEAELKYLSESFGSVFIIPLIGKGKTRSIPLNVKILKPLISRKVKKWHLAFYGLWGLLSFKDFNGIESRGNKIRLVKKIEYLGYGYFIYKQIKKRLIRGEVIHYSYWLNFSAFAIAVLHQKGLIKYCVSRAHRFDIYDEVGEQSLIFIRQSILSNLTNIFFISEHGLNYLKRKFPEVAYKFKLNRLGTIDPCFSNPYSEYGVFSIVSCSSINENKRVDLIAESLEIIKAKSPEQKLKWFHIGGGEKSNEIRSYC